MPPRGAISRWTRRITGLLATAAFLGVGVASYKMIAPARDSAASAALAPTATATPAHHHKAAHHAHKPKPLTKTQKASRRAAVAELRRQGYTTLKRTDYDPRATLRVLVGHPRGDAGAGSYAFFFAGGHYLGRDSLSPTESLRVVRHGKRSVTLSYGTCCPVKHTHVRFKLQDGALAPLQTIPPSYLRAVRR